MTVMTAAPSPSFIRSYASDSAIGRQQSDRSFNMMAWVQIAGVFNWSDIPIELKNNCMSEERRMMARDVVAASAIMR